MPDAARPSPAEPARRILVLQKGPNPTTDYYLLSRLAAAGTPPHEIRSIDDEPPGALVPDGLFVVVCRYIDRRWLRWLEACGDRLAGVALLIDDDVSAMVASSRTKAVYRMFLAWNAGMPLRRLNRLLTDVWASTPPLQTVLRQRGGRVDLLEPSPRLEDHLPRPKTPAQAVRIAFHATDIHTDEHRFLLPIVGRVLETRPAATFEVLARGTNRRRWEKAGIDPDRLKVLPLMSWPVYYRRSRETGADVLLVPLLDGPINAVRADTKRIDCCRLGAAAVYSRGNVYGRRRGEGEVHVENTESAWISAITALVDDADLRERARRATEESVREMARLGLSGLPLAAEPVG